MAQTNDEIINKYGYNVINWRYEENDEEDVNDMLNQARLAALGGKEPACDKCHKQIQTNHNRVVEIRSLQQSEKIKVYHGDCAVLVFAELYPQRDDKIRQAALDDVETEVKRAIKWQSEQTKLKLSNFRIAQNFYAIDILKNLLAKLKALRKKVDTTERLHQR